VGKTISVFIQDKAGCWISEAETTNSLNFPFVQIRVNPWTNLFLLILIQLLMKNRQLFLSAKPEKTNCQFPLRENS
jgi:hypothetical protein